jgi:predicted anti-sigma-YlaC factor YlaD
MIVSTGLLVASLNYIVSDCVCIKHWTEKYIEMPMLIILSAVAFIISWRDYIKTLKNKR